MDKKDMVNEIIKLINENEDLLKLIDYETGKDGYSDFVGKLSCKKNKNYEKLLSLLFKLQ